MAEECREGVSRHDELYESQSPQCQYCPGDSDDELTWISGQVDTGPQSSNGTKGPCRVIVHFDMDCFYAQVEMIRNPALRTVPLGVQQKYIIVTCNYVARELGVRKMMLVTDAMEKCPQLVLVSGEDLSPYREISYRVTGLLEMFFPLVERLGLDENFVDITELVESRLKQQMKLSDISINGHIYNQQPLDVTVQNHCRLAMGSHIAAEIRAAIHSQLGLTGCAGIASNKLLAKLVSGTFKPNQQTTLLPESTVPLLASLRGLHTLPGIGYRTACRLETLGLQSVEDLQRFPLANLEKELGATVARRVHSLSLGIDPSSVTPRGPPQSLSNEDSFRKVSTEAEVRQKVEELIIILLDRMYKDGRTPRTFRLTIRRFPRPVNKWFSRESRQCPVPGFLGQKICSGSDDAVGPLVKLAMKLFHRMVDTSLPFRLTLLSVCFTNLQSSCTKGSIQAFFVHESPGKQKDTPSQGVLLGSTGSSRRSAGGTPQLEPLDSSSECERATSAPPFGVDPSVFQELPADIQRELLSSIPGQSGSVTPSAPEPGVVTALRIPSFERLLQPSSVELHPGREWDADSCGEIGSPACDVPPNVDPQVFTELPLDLQKELLSEWKHETSPLKTQPPARRGRTLVSRGSKSATTSGSQTNNLLKYFKPS